MEDKHNRPSSTEIDCEQVSALPPVPPPMPPVPWSVSEQAVQSPFVRVKPIKPKRLHINSQAGPSSSSSGEVDNPPVPPPRRKRQPQLLAAALQQPEPQIQPPNQLQQPQIYHLRELPPRAPPPPPDLLYGICETVIDSPRRTILFELIRPRAPIRIPSAARLGRLQQPAAYALPPEDPAVLFNFEEDEEHHYGNGNGNGNGNGIGKLKQRITNMLKNLKKRFSFSR